MARIVDATRTALNTWKFNRTPLGQALVLHSKEFFYSGHTLSWLSQEKKNELITGLYQKLVEAQGSPNAPLALREAIAGFAILYAKLALLCLTEGEKSSHFFSGNPYVSGELCQYIMQAAEHCDEAKAFIDGEENTTPDRVMSFANTRSAVMLYFLNGMNMARIAIGDVEQGTDWYLPFVEAQLVAEEDHVRELLGIERLLPPPLHAVAYSSYINFVIDGEATPFKTWRRNFPGYYLAGDGPLP